MAADMKISYCHEMSSSQLNDLWRYENYLGHILLGLPLRNCLAQPVPWGKAMDQNDYTALKKKVRTMYVKASLVMEARETPPYGFGLYAFEDDTNSNIISKTKVCDLGYIVRVPNVDECPTGHRYLRSPAENNCYLGGPISLANYSISGTLNLHKANGVHFASGRQYHSVRVKLMTSFDKIKGKELTWDYGFKKSTPNLFPAHIWFQNSCCSASKADVVAATSSADSVGDNGQGQRSKRKGLATKRKFSQTPKAVKRRSLLLKTYKLCTYCGKNMDQDLHDDKDKNNYKRHWALKHTKDVVSEMDKQNNDDDACDDEDGGGVDKNHFVAHLDVMSITINKLKSSGYHVLPACTFLKANGISPVETTEEKEEVFQKFKKIASQEFKMKQIIYLKGVSVPECYKDLASKCEESKYNSVEWKNCVRPSTRNFSMAQCQYNASEIAAANSRKCEKLLDIIMHCRTLMETSDGEDDDAL